MKICMLNPSFALVKGAVCGGGVPHVVYYLSKALSNLNLGVSIFTRARSESFNNVRVYTYLKPFELRSLVRVQRGHYDLVHSHYSSCLLHAMSRRLKCVCPKLIIHIHHTPFEYLRRFSKSKIVCEAADIVLTPSKKNANLLINLYGIKKHKIRIIPNGADPDRFRYLEREALKLRSKLKLNRKRVILFIGHFASPWKGVDILLGAGSEIIKEFPDSTFLFIGTSAEDALEDRFSRNLKEIVRKVGIEKNVRFMNFVPHPQLPTFYSMADVFVQPSLIESFGMPALEAMACQRPVVATSVGAMPEVITYGVNGLLVKRGDSKALADAVIKVLSNRKLAKYLGKNARETVEKKYDWKLIAQDVKKLYEKI